MQEQRFTQHGHYGCNPEQYSVSEHIRLRDCFNTSSAENSGAAIYMTRYITSVRNFNCNTQALTKINLREPGGQFRRTGNGAALVFAEGGGRQRQRLLLSVDGRILKAPDTAGYAPHYLPSDNAARLVPVISAKK